MIVRLYSGVKMPRPKTLPDTEVLAAAHRLAHAQGPDALTFSALAAVTGLSAPTLVQRFGSKAELVQRALLQAWDGLDARTAELATRLPKTPEGAVRLLTELSGYGGIEAYANGLLVLREDMKDPVLRARGAAWKTALCGALDACFAGTLAPKGVGLLLATHWQGCLLWWSFEPTDRVERFAEASLRSFLAAVLRP
jgi:AcrR family transcriptional regulator